MMRGRLPVLLFVMAWVPLAACGKSRDRPVQSSRPAEAAPPAGSQSASPVPEPQEPKPQEPKPRDQTSPERGKPAAPQPPAPREENPVELQGADTSLRALFESRGIRVGTVGRMNKFPNAPAPFYNDAKYREVLAGEFDAVIGIGTIDILKDGTYRFENLDALLAFAAEKGMELHEQLIFTKHITPPMIPLMERMLSSDAKKPVQFSRMSKSEVAAAKRSLLKHRFTAQERSDAIALLKDHVTRIMTQYRGRIRYWRVVNEALNPDDPASQPLRESFWTRVIGPEFIEIALRTAHQVDPQAILNINDYDMEGLGPKSDAMYALVADLKKRDVPLDAVGFQMHVKTQGYPSADEVRRNIRRLAALGVEVYITEMDVALKLPVKDGDLERQAARFREMADVCLSEPACTKFFTWGFTDRYSWIPETQPGYGDALIFDRNFAPKPAYRALQDAARSP